VIWRALKPSTTEAGAALGSAVLFALAFPPLHLIVPVFVCLVPLAVFVGRRVETGATGAAARVGFWFALLAFGSTLYWIAVALLLFTKLAILAYIATVLCLGGIYAATLAILSMARRLTGWPMAVLLPPLWVASEMLLMHLGDISFPWLPLALGVSHSPHLAQLADVSGEHGLSRRRVDAPPRLERRDRRCLRHRTLRVRGVAAGDHHASAVGAGTRRAAQHSRRRKDAAGAADEVHRDSHGSHARRAGRGPARAHRVAGDGAAGFSRAA
jgi:hypothetical protein